MRELRPGVWHWQAPHPGWSADEPWEQNVSSYALDDGERLLLFDPIAPPGELEKLAGERNTAVVLTNPWHERDTRSLVDRLGTPVHTPRPESAQDLMDKYGITAEQAGDGSPDLRWLLTGEAGEAHWYSPDEGAPAGIEAFAGREPQDLVLWIEDYGTVICGDSFVDFGQGLEIPQQWLRETRPREQVVESLRPLLERPFELVLPTHGAPTDRAALERALS
jgi:glyoxylase-like metal-dependent hydrolase (beta-lactamase superfamily II)